MAMFRQLESLRLTVSSDLAEAVEKSNDGACNSEGYAEAIPDHAAPSSVINPTLNSNCPRRIETNTPKTADPAAARVETTIATTASPLSSKSLASAMTCGNDSF
jgi:hypothetical protein